MLDVMVDVRFLYFPCYKCWWTIRIFNNNFLFPSSLSSDLELPSRVLDFTSSIADSTVTNQLHTSQISQISQIKGNSRTRRDEHTITTNNATLEGYTVATRVVPVTANMWNELDFLFFFFSKLSQTPWQMTPI